MQLEMKGLCTTLYLKFINHSRFKKNEMMKTKNVGLWLTTIAAILLTTIFSSCKDENVEVVGVCPAVISTIPVSGATSVPLNQVISITFNEKMDPATFTPQSIVLEGLAITPAPKRAPSMMDAPLYSVVGPVTATGVVACVGATATFTPSSPLTANTTYTCRVKANVKDLMGNALPVDYVWSFSTGVIILPTVTATNPANNATAVALSQLVTATFSVPMDALTITGSTFVVKQGVNVIAGAVSYSGNVATFTPTVAFLPNTIYTGTITTGAKNTLGIAIGANYVWTFTTAALMAPTVTLTNPLNNAINVPLNQVVTAEFSETMDALTITGTSFTLMQGVNPVAGAVTYLGTTATFTPSAPLANGLVYTAKVTTAAENVAGTPLANDVVWSFTTLTISVPTVTLTNPLNNATNVPLNQIITAEFSENMDALSITGTTFTLMEGVNPITGVVSYLGTTATFAPSAPLVDGKTYSATITTGAQSVAGTPLANDYVWSFSTPAAVIPVVGVDLGSVAAFGIIAGVGVSNNAGFSEIHDMNVGIYPGARSSITGFPPAIIVNGAMFASDDIAPPGVPAMLLQAQDDLTAAYLFAEGATSPAPATVSGDIGGTTLAPGIYKSTSTLLIQSGNLTLDAQGDVNAVWIFQIASDFTTVGGAGGNVVLSGGAQAKNVFWQTGSSATIGDFTSFKGNVLALTSITMNSGAVAEGRMLARNGSVVLTDTNIITKP